MTEQQAQAWILARFGAAGVAAMETLAALVLAESARQNLIAPSTIPQLWARHIVDSAQLIDHAASADGCWIDIGSGAGFPGLVVAALTDRPLMLVEPRKRRADFLAYCRTALGLDAHLTVVCSRIEAVKESAAVISARAVAALPLLLAAAQHCSTWNTLWLLPKGSNAREEMETARRAWHGTFHVEHSITNPDSMIVVAHGIAPR